MTSLWKNILKTAQVSYSRWSFLQLNLGAPSLMHCIQDRRPNIQEMQVRTKYVDWRMIRDEKRRKMVKQYNAERQRVNSIRKNTILPRELQEVADKDIAAFPRDSCITRLRARCIVTSRPRSVKRSWRLSRIVWRQLVDYNQMSGITRACW
ncbi:28S ribosomal protein S14, mitochondrial-like [Gigantopelta aegis]|uniref:28S ribosomal protein S14, mitochondrial-like n=1 Tax=Gigantopelta aegis TaxID=1735272 RepID=UPI001B88E764|nr:28S ribosomal protein S14, mitochondrial-like [Gigantopelta aegis]